MTPYSKLLNETEAPWRIYLFKTGPNLVHGEYVVEEFRGSLKMTKMQELKYNLELP